MEATGSGEIVEATENLKTHKPVSCDVISYSVKRTEC